MATTTTSTKLATAAMAAWVKQVNVAYFNVLKAHALMQRQVIPVYYYQSAVTYYQHLQASKP